MSRLFKKTLLTFLFLMVLESLSLADTSNLPKTGQATCYDSAGNVVSCAGTGQDGDWQAGVPWPSPRFTDNGDGTVTDNLTGLIWLKNANCFGSDTWQGALNAANNLADGQCGLSDGSQAGDWRLPNVNELESLVHAGYKEEDCGGSACSTLAAWLNTQGFTNVQSAYYWSSTTYASNTDDAWIVSMSNNIMYNFGKSGGNHYVWSVRDTTAGPVHLLQTGQTTSYATGDDGDLQKGVPWPSPRFTDNGDGTVTDNLTGLIWLKDANCFGLKSWQDALDAANNLADGQCGLSDGSQTGDWRLPNSKELRSLIDYSQYFFALPLGNPFNRVQLDYYWSSSTYAYITDRALIVYMGNAFVFATDKTDIKYVWPVRGEQGGLSYNLVISKSGTGSGTVTSTPSGIDCGNTCSAQFASGNPVQLIATEDAGSTFTGWGGDCTPCGSNTTCQITMNGDMTCLANFGPNTPLSLSLDTSLLPDGIIPYGGNGTYGPEQVQMNATGGTGFYAFDCSISGPGGISATMSGSGTCVIEGSPEDAGIYTVYFSVSDSDGNYDVKQLSFETVDVVPELVNGRPERIVLLPDYWMIYKFYADGTGPDNNPVTFRLSGQPGGNSDMIIKYAGPECDGIIPNREDHDLIVSYVSTYGNSVWDPWIADWTPPLAMPDFYYNISPDSNEKVDIYGDPDNPHGCYYVMILNAGNSTETLSITASDPDSTDASPCQPDKTVVTPAAVYFESLPGQQVNFSIDVRDNCGQPLDYVIVGVGFSNIMSPGFGDIGTGTIPVSVDMSGVSYMYKGYIVVSTDFHPDTFVNLAGYFKNVILRSPNGGEAIQSGGQYTITWDAIPEATTFDLEYSINGGATWRTIATGLTGTSYQWSVPTVAGNKRKCLVRVTAYDSNGVQVWQDTSDAWFMIEVVKITSPNGGETYAPGDTLPITWITNATKTPVTKVVLKYHKVGMPGWNVITVIKGNNPGSYDWVIPPDMPPGNYRIKINLFDASRNRRGGDRTDGVFTIVGSASPPPCNNTPPTITIDQCPASVVNVGDALTATFTTSDQDGDTVVVTDNLGGTVSGNTWSWTASSVGSYTLILTANDGQICNNLAVVTCQFNVTDPAVPAPLTLQGVPATLPDATAGEQYNNGNPYYVNLSATGGTPPYTFRCRVKSATSQGITATPNGNTCTIEGTPDSAGYVDIAFKVVDANGDKIPKTKRITVNPPSGQGEPPGVIDLTDKALGNYADPNGPQKLSPGSSQYYKCVVPNGTAYVTFELGSMHGLYGNADMLISQGLPYPEVADYINEPQYLAGYMRWNGYQKNGKILYGSLKPDDGTVGSDTSEGMMVFDPVPTTYYILVHNTHTTETSQYYVACHSSR